MTVHNVPLSWKQRGRLWLRLGIRLLLLLLSLLFLRWIGLPLLSLLAPFVAALVTGALLHPLVGWLRRSLGWPRPLSTLVILLFIFGLLGGVFGYLLYAAISELVALVQNWDSVLQNIQGTVRQLEDLSTRLWGLLPPQLLETGQDLLDGAFLWLKNEMSTLLSTLMTYTTEKAKGVPTFGLAFVMYVMASYLITVDYPKLRTEAAQRTHAKLLHFLKQIRDTSMTAFGGYIRAEFLLSIVAFFILLVGFLLMGQPYSLLLALGLAILDFIPIVGAGTVMIPWSFVALFTHQYRTAISLMLIWGVIALFRRLAEPKFLGDQTGLSPILSFISIYIGMRLAGVLGMVLGPILALIVVNLWKLGLFQRTKQDLLCAAEDVIALLEEPIGKPPSQ